MRSWLLMASGTCSLIQSTSFPDKLARGSSTCRPFSNLRETFLPAALKRTKAAVMVLPAVLVHTRGWCGTSASCAGASGSNTAARTVNNRVVIPR